MADIDIKSETSVLIAGAGPVGLALACELGLRGVDCVLIEKRDGTISVPKMSAVSARTMEFCRRWGIAGKVRTAVWSERHGMDFVYVENLRGRELARTRRPPLSEWGKLDFTPEGGCHCPQIYFDPILAARVKTLPSVKLRYSTRLDAFIQDGETVRARVTDLAANATETLVARYLVGCDGPAGIVREALGIRLGGLGVVANSVNIFFRSPELASLHDKGWARIYRLVDAGGCWAELIPIDGRELWRLTVFDDPAAVAEPAAALARMAGGDFPHEILSVTLWERRDFVAESFGQGRVLIAGDAAHECSPTGGLGMHTGIEEAVNLAWKLAAVIAGWGGPGLIASYAEERRPIALRHVAFSTRTFNAIRSIPATDAVAPLDDSGRDWRQNLASMAPSEKDKMDYCYERSPVCVADESAGADQGSAATRPGVRAPHAWLSDGRSTLDLFGDGFILLRFGDAHGRGLLGAARLRGMPIRAVDIGDPVVAALYGRKLVLVRPDGYVAWRGDHDPADAEAVVDRVRGTVSNVAAALARSAVEAST
jgi:2-polyprenyl-6-methoxyphenol hydroxylase-like FAD-dependent oxidoreductase